MIAIERRGQLGNHMFQWAFGISASRRLETAFVMKHHSLSGLFMLDGYTALRPRLRRMPWLARELVHRRPIIEITNEDDPKAVMTALRDGVRYGGFFQSADYFSDDRDAVLRAFTLRREHAQRFKAAYADLLGRDYVCVHVRRGDYLAWRGGSALPSSHIRRCLELARGENPVVFISDDIASVRSEFASHPNARFESNDPILDLQLMIHANTCVVSSSSFAWWGAWLNRRPRRRVLAPRYWLGFRRGQEWPRNVIPADWDQVPVQLDEPA
jgi:hypothetical protein